MPFPFMRGVQDLCWDRNQPLALEKSLQCAKSSSVLLQRRKAE